MRARVAGTQRQTKFQPITSAEAREGHGEAEDEGPKDAPPVPRATDDEFDPPVRMDSSDDEDAAPPVPGATRMDSSDDEQEAYCRDNID